MSDKKEEPKKTTEEIIKVYNFIIKKKDLLTD